MKLSVVLITYNEEANLARTLESVMPLVCDGKGEIIVVDSGSTDRTVEIAKSFGAKVFVEEWKGYAAQKNSAMEKATGEWILSLDADESIDSDLASEIRHLILGEARPPIKEGVATTAAVPVAHIVQGFLIPRKNFFLGRWIRHGGFWPDPKPRLFRRGSGQFENRLVHENVKINGTSGNLASGALLHHSYPTLTDYLEHMNHYSSLGGEIAAAQGYRHFSILHIALRPLTTFIYNYFFRLGFLDGREGLLLHLYHAAYVSWKYAKAWELGRMKSPGK